MTALGVKPGRGWQHGGPNAPLNALELALRNAEEMGARAGSLILGLPLYGRVYVCDGGSVVAQGRDGSGGAPECNCAEKNFVSQRFSVPFPVMFSLSLCVRRILQGGFSEEKDRGPHDLTCSWLFVWLRQSERDTVSMYPPCSGDTVQIACGYLTLSNCPL